MLFGENCVVSKFYRLLNECSVKILSAYEMIEKG